MSILEPLARLFNIARDRSDERELMDDLSIQGEELEVTLRDIERLNLLFGGYPPSLEGLARLCPRDAKTVRVLDVGTGGADIPRRMVEWGRARGVEVRVKAIDLSETTVSRARRLSRSHPEIDVEQTSLFDLDESDPFDVVHAASVLHHFGGDSATRALAKMYSLCRWGVIINDLHRTFSAWVGAKLVAALFTTSRLVANDAPLSMLRAFTRRDFVEIARAAGLPEPEIAWRPLFRWRVVIRRMGGGRPIP